MSAEWARVVLELAGFGMFVAAIYLWFGIPAALIALAVLLLFLSNLAEWPEGKAQKTEDTGIHAGPLDPRSSLQRAIDNKGRGGVL